MWPGRLGGEGEVAWRKSARERAGRVLYLYLYRRRSCV